MQKNSRKWILIFSATATITLTLPGSAAPVKTEKRDYDSARKQVCEGSDADHLCSKIDHEVNRGVADTIAAMKPVIHAAAKTYGVDPVAIVGSLLAEHSMNTGAEDFIQDAAVNLGLAKFGTIDFGFYKKKFTFGFGQLNFDRALEAEAIAAAVEKRQLRTNDQVKDSLMTPEGAAYYAAALIRQAQDLYLNAGYDLSEDPAVLTTLYNIGKLNERIERTKKEGRPPQPNYFGVFVLKNLDRIKEIVGDYNPNADISLAKNKGNAPADSPYEIRYAAKENLHPLKSGMTSIGMSNAAFAMTSLVLKPGDQFDIKGSVEDPTLGTLHLVQAIDGKMGYLPEALIAKKSQQILVEKKTCAVNGDKKCLEDMDDYLSETDGETFAFMNPVPRKKKPEKKMSPREKILHEAQVQAEDLLNKFSKQVITWSDSEAKDAKNTAQKVFDKLDPMLGNFAATMDKQIAALNNKKKALESLPKLEERDMVEILSAIRDFREKAAKAQPNRMGAVTSPYTVFEPLMEFYEICAIQHHGNSDHIGMFFSESVQKKNLSFDHAHYPHQQDGDVFEGMRTGSNPKAVALYFYRRLERESRTSDAKYAPSKRKGREGNMERVVDGENCYGDKKQFLNWIKSVPVKANPSWTELEKPYEEIKSFYLPITNKNDIKAKIDYIPTEIAEIQRNAKRAMAKVETIYPKIKEKVSTTLKMLEAKSKKEVAKQHPVVVAADKLRDKITSCKLAVVKNPELLKKIEAVDAQLQADISQLIVNYDRGNSQTMLLDYYSYDSLVNLLYTIYPNGIPNDLNSIIKSYVPIRMGLPDYGADVISRWDVLGSLLNSSCGVFDDPLLSAYLEDPSSLPAGAENCTLEITEANSVLNYGNIRNIEMSLAKIKERLGNEKDRANYIEEQLQGYNRYYYGRYGDSSGATQAARFPDYHSLAKELSEKDCVQAIFVSRVQELDLPKTVLLPSGDTNSIRVVWKGTKCN